MRSALHERPEFRLTGFVEADETYVGARHERGVPGRRLEGKSLQLQFVCTRQVRAWIWPPLPNQASCHSIG